MFIKRLIIKSKTRTIRDLSFSMGLNLIVDSTPTQNSKSTGNNVGKTTVLKLIDFCLGADAKIIYTDTENVKEVYSVVKDFVTDENIVVTLILAEDLTISNAKEIVIERDFASGKKARRLINGKAVLAKEFDAELEKVLFPNKTSEKPTLRQLISHNIRYTENSINHTLKTLSSYTSNLEYETLYLYLLGCDFDKGEKRQQLVTKISQETAFKERLEKMQSKVAYEITLASLEDDITELNNKKASFNLNEALTADLDELNSVKFRINKFSSLVTKLEIRKQLIEESVAELEMGKSSIDLEQLRILYEEAKINVEGIQKTFEDLVVFHNRMISEKIKYISADLPMVKVQLKDAREELSSLLEQEKQLTMQVSKKESVDELESIITVLNDKYREKGECENIIQQLDEVYSVIEQLSAQLQTIDDELFSGDFETVLKDRVTSFNKYFAMVSQELYGEKYLLKYEKRTNKNNKEFYEFNSFNQNMSPGKKQGEILCFDIAYILFADHREMPCLHFLLNDKKELMHDNQWVQVADYLQNKNMQVIISVLKDKVPQSAFDKSKIVVELSSDSKLFKIESDNDIK